MRRPLVVGNWKMHGDGAWLPVIDAIAASASAIPDVDVALCIPATLIHRAATRCPALAIGGQDCHPAAAGAHTGGITAAMLREAGARTVILGHSERRHACGETDAIVAVKCRTAHDAGLDVILCVGETLAERQGGAAVANVCAQLAACLHGVRDRLTIAYEPVWTIGSGRSMAMPDISVMVAALRNTLAAHGQPGTAVLYGGSVVPGIAADILATGVDGLLVGKASLKADDFTAVLAAVACRAHTPACGIGSPRRDS